MIRRLVDSYARDRILLAKEMVTLYEDVQDFLVAEAVPVGDVTALDVPEGPQPVEHSPTPQVIGCGALHVMWEDLAEVRTLAVDRDWLGHGVGAALLGELMKVARGLGVARVFCLTFEVAFFRSMGFDVIEGTPVPPAVFAQLLRSYDEGVAEFLDLERVKPNTLGNTRMLYRF